MKATKTELYDLGSLALSMIEGLDTLVCAIKSNSEKNGHTHNLTKIADTLQMTTFT